MPEEILGVNGEVLDEVNLEEFFGDDFDDSDFLEVTATTANPYLSQGLVDIAISYLETIRDDYIRLLGYNRAISKTIPMIIETTANKTKQRYASAKGNKEDPYRENRNRIRAKLQVIQEDFTKEANLTKGGLHHTSRITPLFVSGITDNIPSEYGKSVFASIRKRLVSKYNNSELSPLTFEERREVANTLAKILYHMEGDALANNKVVEGVNVVTDVIAAQEEKISSISNDLKFGIPQYEIRNKVAAINELITLLKDKDVLTNLGTPDVYKIDNISEYVNRSTKDRSTDILGSLYLSNSANPIQNINLTYTTGFNTRAHLMGVCRLPVNRRSSESLIDSMNMEVNKLVTTCKIDNYKAPEDPNIIEIPYCFIGKHSNDKPFVVIGVNDTVYDIKYFENFLYNGRSILSYVKDLSLKRIINDNGDPWSVCITASPEISDQLIPEYDLNDELEESTRFSEAELYEIVKNKNIKEYLTNGYSSKVNVDYAKAHKEITSIYIAKDNELIDKYKVLLSKMFYLNEDKIKLGFTGNYTPNRSILMQSISSEFSKPIQSRVEVVEMFNRQEEVYRKKVNFSYLSRLEYTRDNIAFLLGEEAIEREDFFDYINNKEYTRDKKFRLELNASDIFDTFWFVLRLHELGYNIQSFRTEQVTKGDSKVSKEELLMDIRSFLDKPCSLIECWGITPHVNSDKGLIIKSSKLYHACLVFLVEAYGIFNIILNDEGYQEYLEFLNTSYKRMSNKGDEDLKIREFKYNVDLDAPHCVYEDVADYVSEDYYNEYVKYMNSFVINPILVSIGSVKSNFDSKMLINAYIKFICGIKYPSFSNEAALGLAHTSIQEDYDLDVEYASVVDELLDEGILDADSLLNHLEFFKPDQLDEASLQRLTGLMQDAINIMHITKLPLNFLLKTLESKSDLSTFTDDDIHAFYVQIGRDVARNQDFKITEDTFVKDLTLEVYSDNIFNAESVTVARDIRNMKILLNTTKFKQIVKRFSKCQTIEEWDELYEVLDSHIHRMLDKDLNNEIQSAYNSIQNKLCETISFSELKDVLDSFSHIFLVTPIDTYLLLNVVSNALADTIAFKSSELDISKIKISRELTVDDIKALNQEVATVTRYYDTALNLSFLLPMSILEDAVQKKSDCADKIAKNTEVEDSLLSRSRKTKKSIVLFQRYLASGKAEFRDEVDMDVIPFELLTTETCTEGGVCGPYSRPNLIMDFALTDSGNPDDKEGKELAKRPFIELFDLIIAQVPDFLNDCPKAIADYIEREHKLNNAVIE